MGKFLYFLIFAVLAGFSFIGASNRDIFVCDNTTKECFIRQENSVLKTQRNLNKKYLGPNKAAVAYKYTDGSLVKAAPELTDRYYTRYDYVTCRKNVKTVKRESGTKESVSYWLVPYKNKYSSIMNLTPLKKYNSESACIVDMEVIQRYLQSSGSDILEYQSAQNFLNIIFYLLAGVLGVFAIIILFGQEVSSCEVEDTLSDEQKKAVADKIKGYAEVLNNLDADTANKLKDLSAKVSRFGYRVHNNRNK